MIDYHNPKHFSLYWKLAEDARDASIARRHQVGAVVVLPSGLISLGWNGMPSGFDNDCEVWNEELQRYKTRPEVIHAEINALKKLHRAGVSVTAAIVFTTRAPCLPCAVQLIDLGLRNIFYDEPHDDMRGVELLQHGRVIVRSRQELGEALASYRRTEGYPPVYAR